MKKIKMVLRGGLIFLLISLGIAYGADWITQRLTNTPGDSGSPKIAVNGSAVYVVWKDDTPGNNEIYFRKSTNGGVAWQTAQRLTANAGDSLSPAIAVDGSNVYVVWENSTRGVSQIYFMKSEDGGNHWQAARVLTKNKTAKAQKPAIAVAGENIYVAWQNDDSANGGNCWIALTKSSDRGAGWQAARTISGNIGSADARNPSVAAADSAVYVAWEENSAGNNEIYFRTSMNGGGFWQAALRLTANSGFSGSPSVAALGSIVYLAWSDATPGNQEIYFRKSPDQGVTWQAGVRLTNTSGRSEAPALAVDGSNLYVVWDDDTRGNFEISHRQSMNGGADWQEIERLTNNSGSSRGPSLGVSGSKIFVVWQDPTPGNNEIFLAHKNSDPISVILPNGFSTWFKGATGTIKWQINESTAKVKIALYAGSRQITPIVAGISAGAGTYSWKVPANLADGSDYKVRISSAADAEIFRDGMTFQDSPAFRIMTGTQPDLVVDNLTHGPANPTTANTITVTAVVKNVGAAQAEASTLYLKGSWEENPTTHAIPVLAVGGTATVIRTVGPLSAASYVVAAQADVNAEVIESDELNNGKTDSFVVVQPPDLVVDSLTHSPANPTTENTIMVTAVVKNIGISAAAASNLKLTWSGGTVDYDTGPLAAGATSTISHVLGPLAAGSQTLVAEADSADIVAESNESNNGQSDSFEVAHPPDLVVDSLTYGPQPLSTMNAITATVVVKNIGLSAADASTLKLTWSGGTAYYSTGPLAAGATSTISHGLGLLAAGSQTLVAEADSDNVVAESNESNNLKSDSFTVRVLPDLVVSVTCWIGRQSYSPFNFYLVLEVTIKNIGPGDADSSYFKWEGGIYAVPPLRAGDSFRDYLGGLPIPYKGPPFFLTVDYDSRVDEWNESNNTAIFSW